MEQAQRLLCLLFGPRKTSFDGGGNAASRAEFAADYCPDGIAGLHYVFQDLIDNVFLKNAEVAVTEEVLLERFELEAAVTRHVAHVEDAEVRQACLGADRGQLRIVDGNFVTRELVLPCLDRREFKVESGFGMVVRIAGLRSHKPIVRAALMANE